MRSINPPRTPLRHRLARFHRAIWNLHVRRYRHLRRYHFFHAVWMLPVATLIGTAIRPDEIPDHWVLATVTWLSLAWRVSEPTRHGDNTSDKTKRWWPSYSLPVTAGLTLCSALMGLTAVENVIDIPPLTRLDGHLLALLIQAVSIALILSTVFYFFLGYFAALLQLSMRRAPRHDEHRTRLAKGRGFQLLMRIRTKSGLYMACLLLVFGVWLYVSNLPLATSELPLFLMLIPPILFYRSPWSIDRRGSFFAIVPHFQILAIAADLLAPLLPNYWDLLSSFPLILLLGELPRYGEHSSPVTTRPVLAVG